jgi:CheY-like chemotaxis protein
MEKEGLKLNIFKKENHKILLVEDDPDNMKLLELFLKRGGFQVQTAINGKEALEIFKKDFSIDLILMDVQMPVMDGLASVRAIRLLEKDILQGKKNHIPIIALTAGVMKGDEEKCLEAGYDHFIAKPANINLLFSILGKFLKIK